MHTTSENGIRNLRGREEPYPAQNRVLDELAWPGRRRNSEINLICLNRIQPFREGNARAELPKNARSPRKLNMGPIYSRWADLLPDAKHRNRFSRGTLRLLFGQWFRQGFLSAGVLETLYRRRFFNQSGIAGPRQSTSREGSTNFNSRHDV
jgi:hypothetical protein